MPTAERGCCPECGAPWEREVERKSLNPWSERKANGAAAGSKERGYNENHGAGMSHTLGSSVTTTGWGATCACERPPVPCTVLDPFMGSGTTALVARRLGRRSVGIELNPEYAKLCARRLQQLSLFATEDPTPAATLTAHRGLTGGAYNPPGQSPHSNARGKP